ncbi:MAG: hypothetical protein EVB09_09100 [Verrucomicrobiaceae bacterium]|nr:MAG: hypothetical protein EVB09_09100 [Verrucomicrobiaceae bacterium]
MALKKSSSVPKQIRVAIGRMRRAVQRHFLVDGLKNVLLVVLVLIIIDFTLDRTFRMDGPQRLIMLILSVSIIGYAVYRKLLGPLLSRLSDDALMIELEEAEGGMDEVLISALEFSRMGIESNDNVSIKMVENTINEGAEAVSKVTIESAFRRKKMRANSLVLILILLCFVGAGVSASRNQVLDIWFKRNVLLSDIPWPSNYVLELSGYKDGRIRVPRGEDWSLVVSVKENYKELPNNVIIEYRYEKGKRKSSESMIPNSLGNEFRSNAIDVSEPLRLRVRSKEYETEWIPMELVDRPKIEDFSILASYPEYTGIGEQILSSDEGPYSLLNGTSIKINGKVNKSLRSASITVGGVEYPLEVKESKFAGVLPKEQVISGVYEVNVEDLEEMGFSENGEVMGLGLRERATFKIRIQNDRKPKVVASVEGVSGLIVPEAMIPYVGIIEDDYAVKEVNIRYSWKEDQGEREEVTDSMVPDEVINLLGKKQIPLDGRLDLSGLDIPLNSRFSMVLVAKDNNEVSGPNIGESTKILLRVVGEAELRTDLLRREKEQRQILLELVKKQDLLLTDTGALAAELLDVDVLGRSEKEKLAGLQKRQKLLSVSVNNIVKRLDGMVNEIVNNRLEDEDGILKQRLRQKVIVPLANLVNEVIPVAALELDSSRRMLEKDSRNESMRSASQYQVTALEVMKEVLVHMVRNEGYQQAVNLLYEIQRAQERMSKMTAKAKEESLGNVVREKEEGSNTNEEQKESVDDLKEDEAKKGDN